MHNHSDCATVTLDMHGIDLDYAPIDLDYEPIDLDYAHTPRQCPRRPGLRALLT